jgi:uncharacterized protein DUF4054
MSYGTEPDLYGILANWWGGDFDGFGWGWGASPAPIGFIFGTNPPYSVADFLAFYPQFGGVQVTGYATVTNGYRALTSVGSLTIGYGTGAFGTNVVPLIVPGTPIAAAGFPDGSVVTSVGATATATGNVTASSQVVTGVTGLAYTAAAGAWGMANTPVLAPGQQVSGPGIPANTVIETVGSGTFAMNTVATATATGETLVFNPIPNDGSVILLSQVATATASGVPIVLWPSPLLPFLVLQVFVNLANAGLQQARYQDSWLLAMNLYVAHLATLYLQSQGNPGSTAGQIASLGLKIGMLASKSAGDVSAGYQNLMDQSIYGEFGNLTLTTYGQALMTIAMSVIGVATLYIP